MNVPQTTTEYTEKLRQALQQDTTLRQLAAQSTTRSDAASTAGPSAWSSGLAKRRSITPARPRHRAWCWVDTKRPPTPSGPRKTPRAGWWRLSATTTAHAATEYHRGRAAPIPPAPGGGCGARCFRPASSRRRGVRQSGLFPCSCTCTHPPAPGGIRLNVHTTGQAAHVRLPLIFHMLPTVTIYALELFNTLWYALILYRVLPPCFQKGDTPWKSCGSLATSCSASCCGTSTAA